MNLIKALAGIATVVMAIISYLAYKKSKIESKLSSRKLKYHPIHHRINDFKEYIDYEFDARTEGREKLVKNFLTHMMEIYEVKFKKLAETVDEKNLTNEELKELNLRTLHEAINKRSTYFYTDEYTERERVALDLLVKKYQMKMSSRIKYFKEDVKKVIDSKYYNDQVTMQALIFDKYIGELSHVLTWFEDIIDDINGDFCGLKFKGKPLDNNKKEE